MKMRKSKLASDTLKLVQVFFNGAEYSGQLCKIREYVHWALQYGGPAYYETPIPHSWLLGKGNSGPPVRSHYGWGVVLRTYIRNQVASYACSSLFRLLRQTSSS